MSTLFALHTALFSLINGFNFTKWFAKILNLEEAVAIQKLHYTGQHLFFYDSFSDLEHCHSSKSWCCDRNWSTCWNYKLEIAMGRAAQDWAGQGEGGKQRHSGVSLSLSHSLSSLCLALEDASHEKKGSQRAPWPLAPCLWNAMGLSLHNSRDEQQLSSNADCSWGILNTFHSPELQQLWATAASSLA